MIERIAAVSFKRTSAINRLRKVFIRSEVIACNELLCSCNEQRQPINLVFLIMSVLVWRPLRKSRILYRRIFLLQAICVLLDRRCIRADFFRHLDKSPRDLRLPSCQILQNKTNVRIKDSVFGLTYQKSNPIVATDHNLT